MTLKRLASLILLCALGGPAWSDFYTGLEAYKKGDHDTAIKNWRSLAIQGNASAQYDLALVHLSGEGGLPRDPVKASYWLRKAAAQKLPRAQAMLGTLFEQGLGVALSYERATALYHKASQAGDPLGMYRLGMMYKAGRGLEQSSSQAAVWLRHAAERGLAPAQYQLGVLYYRGEGVPRRFKEAYKWHSRAAEQGNLNAIITLGLLYFKGEGVEEDYLEAYSWWSTAVAAGDNQSIKARDAVAGMLSPEELKKARKMARIKRTRIFMLSDTASTPQEETSR